MEKVLLTVDGSRGSWYTYVNGTGLVSKVNFDGYYVQNTFDELNRTESRRYTFDGKKSVFETIDYNIVGNRTDGKVMSHSFGRAYEFNYEYDQNGNITRISDDSGNLRNEYTYDELGRLTSEINIPTGSQSSKAVVGEKIEYLYSKDGNIYQRNFYKVQALQGKAYVDAKANRSDSFGYSNTEWSDQLSSARINGKGFNFTYDKIGNPLSYRDGMVMSWQNGRQLKSIKVDDTTTLEFTYDINGQRQSKVEKKNGAAVHTTKYYYDGTKLVGENKDGTIVWYDYDEDGTPIGMRLSGDDYVFRRNLQGDITGIFDSTGTLVVEYTYGNAWGFGVTVSGSKAAEIGTYNSLRYRGYYYDSESGLYYLNTRYYDPSICRFVNADGYVSTGQGTQGYNMYSYCVFNPVNMVDPTGEEAVAIAIGGIAFAFISAAIILAQPQVQQGISNSIDSVVNDIISKKSAKSRASEKSESIPRQIKDSDPRIHHIVAQKDPRCAAARIALINAGIDPIKDERNKITIPQGLHKSMHTTKYYEYVTSKITAYPITKESVERALLELKLDILFASTSGIRKWDIQ